MSKNYSCSSYVLFLAALPLEMFLVTTLESGFAELDAVLQIVRGILNIFYNSFKISEHMSAWTHLINLNMVIARFIWPDYALEVNYKICSVLRYMGQADMILEIFPQPNFA